MSKQIPWSKRIKDAAAGKDAMHVEPQTLNELVSNWETCAVGECLKKLKIPEGQREEIALSYPELETLGMEFDREISDRLWCKAAWTLGQIRKVIRKHKIKILEQYERLNKLGI